MMLVPLGPGEEGRAWLAGTGMENGQQGAHQPASASPLYLSVSPVGGDVGRGLWMLQSLPVQSAWQMHFPSLLQTYRRGGASTGKQGRVPA